jgi:hypothetical protein
MTVFPPIAAIRAPFQTHPSKFGFCGGAHWYGCDRPYSKIALPAKKTHPHKGILGRDGQRRVAGAERAQPHTRASAVVLPHNDAQGCLQELISANRTVRNKSPTGDL